MRFDVTSVDGTVLGANLTGTGPPLVLVHGGTADQTRWAPLVPLLRDEFTVVTYDRRGRGASTNESPGYAIEREGEDLLAVLSVVGPAPLVFAHSYGATVTLSVLDRLPAGAALLYEPPFDTAQHQVVPEHQLGQWTELLERGEREAVLEDFYRETLAVDEDVVDQLRLLPIWQARVAAAHTLVREARALRVAQPQIVKASIPVRILIGELTTPPLAASTRQAAAAVDGSECFTLPGHGHLAIDAAPDLIAHHIREIWQRARKLRQR